MTSINQNTFSRKLSDRSDHVEHDEGHDRSQCAVVTFFERELNLDLAGVPSGAQGKVKSSPFGNLCGEPVQTRKRGHGREENEEREGAGKCQHESRATKA